ncbi:DAHL domain-containing protein [Paenacidovorax monticola]|uniref:histidine kinase n=1 Tax=Paenacidovorax monticola TaxID=1926868 RepID=A0A7H0HH21_9BURK|nr:DAHL domain-containing protein [Paenacidovorax monticola]QNP59837.1 histidine kinase [Paenacidovorax monticola]
MNTAALPQDSEFPPPHTAEPPAPEQSPARWRSPHWRIAVLALVLLVIFGALLAQTRSNGKSHYFENTAVLAQIKQLDDEWELEVLKTQIGIVQGYDAFGAAQRKVQDHLQTLQAQLELMDGDNRRLLGAASTALQAAVQSKSALIGQFAEHHTRLRDAMERVPIAMQELQMALSDRTAAPAAAPASTLAETNRLFARTTAYSQGASSAQALALSAEFTFLLASEETQLLSTAQRARLTSFVDLVHTMLKEQITVHDLLEQIAATPTDKYIDEITTTLNEEQRRTAEHVQQYRLYMLGFSGVLIALFIYAVVHVVRGHAEVNRVNRALQAMNEGLEHRVRKRTRELEQAQVVVAASARQAGMAEIATNILHNVGNVLNSLNVSTQITIDKARASKLAGVARTAQLLKEHEDRLGTFMSEDPRGKMLPGYLQQLAQALDTERNDLLEELGGLMRSVEHIKDVIAMQQAYAGAGSVTVAIHPEELVEDALRISADSLSRHRIVVEKDYAATPELLLDRSRIMQILVNLISNAKQAYGGVTDRPHTVRLSVGLAEGNLLRISVTDNGVGITAQHMARIFSHGFTTKPDGHGFGLHSAVIAAQEMGGSLSAFSDGADKGARFTLELPARRAAAGA